MNRPGLLPDTNLLIMNIVFRAYSINHVDNLDGIYSLIICDSFNGKTRQITIDASQSFQTNNDEVFVVFGKVPAEIAKDFKSDCLHFCGLPTKEECITEMGPIELKSILYYCKPEVFPMEEGDILILQEYCLESLIELTIERSSNQPE